MRYVIGMMFVALFTAGCGFEYDTNNDTTLSKKSKHADSPDVFDRKPWKTWSHPACGSGWRWRLLLTDLSNLRIATNHTCKNNKSRTFNNQLQYPISRMSLSARTVLKTSDEICFGFAGDSSIRSNHDSVGIKQSLYVTTLTQKKVFGHLLPGRGRDYQSPIHHAKILSMHDKLKSSLDDIVVKFTVNTTYTCDMSRGENESPRTGQTSAHNTFYIYAR